MDGAAEELAARSTVWDYLDLWDWDGTLERIHHALYVEVREQAGREARVIGSWPVTLSSLRTGSYDGDFSRPARRRRAGLLEWWKEPLLGQHPLLLVAFAATACESHSRFQTCWRTISYQPGSTVRVWCSS